MGDVITSETFTDFLDFLKEEEKRLEDPTLNNSLNDAVKDKISNLRNASRLSLNGDKIPLLESRKHFKLCREILNLVDKQSNYCKYQEEFAKTDDIVKKLTETNQEDELNGYFYSKKTKNAFLVGDDDDKSKENLVRMREALGNCGFNCFIADGLDQFGKYLKDNFVIGDNFVDFIFYYSGSSVTLDENKELLFKDGVSLGKIIESLNTIENSIKEEQIGKLTRYFCEQDKNKNKETNEVNSIYSKLFKIEYKKLFIFDIFKNDSTLEMERPTFKETKDYTFFYSNIPSILNSFNNMTATIFTNSLIGRIYSDIGKNKGRNVSSIAKVIQFIVIDKLNIFKESFDNQGENSFIELQRKSLIDIYGSLDELSFGRILLDNMPIIYGDASNGDFLIYDA